MAERKEVLLKSLQMLLQYPKPGVITTDLKGYEDYRRLYRSYIKAYKQLYEDVAAFSFLPERFIQQAEPIIEKYLHNYSLNENNGQQEWLKIITDFINRFYDFMDEATEMFAEHQALADETLAFLQTIALLETKNKNGSNYERSIDFVHLVPELQHLATSLKVVREAVDTTTAHLENLEPVWEAIKTKIK